MSKATGESGPSSLIRALRDLGESVAFGRRVRLADQLRLHAHDLFPGDTARGQALLVDQFILAGQTVTTLESNPWAQTGQSEHWLAALYGFGWLRDLRAAANGPAKLKARALLESWLAGGAALPALAERPDVVGSRLTAWSANAEFFLHDASDDFRRRFVHSFTAQYRQLTKTQRRAGDGLERLLALKGLLIGALALGDDERRIAPIIKQLDQELGRQILPDGAQLERSPSIHFNLLAELIALKATLETARRELPVALQNAIDRMAPILRTYRHGDGGLALFNSSNEEEAWAIDLVLGQCDSKGRPLTNAPHGGFRRVQAGRTLLIMDTGVPSRVGRAGHAGTLSFELSVGKDRLIVNCGHWPGSDQSWRRALSATAAHSTLTVDDTNSALLREEGGIGNGAIHVTVNREDQDGAAWIDASHDGYLEPFGLTHWRRLYVSAEGTDLRGEDRLVRTQKKQVGGRAFAVRFHLHPEVQASQVQDGSSVLLRGPSGAGWQMRASGGALDLNESVYAGRAGERRRSTQIVLTGPLEPDETIIKWALRRIPKG
jgi:uncharacterized heparinase superfamily protein